ncbi:MAG: DUF3466 family protein, partial [Bacteroidales bacterium]|nr:DUF3466 family protein [Bacteroidales bacterium]
TNNVWAIPGYSITDMGAINNDNSMAYAINDKGQVVGSSGVGTDGHAFIWEDGTLTDIGAVGGGLGAADINDAGIVVGHSDSKGLINGAFVWEDNQVNALGTLPSGQWSYAFGINETGTIVGKSNLISGSTSYYHAVQWENGYMIDLGTIENQTDYIHSSQANAINDNGVVAGFSFGTPDGSDWGVYAVVWEDGSIKNLSTLGNGSQANDINNAGQIVGSISYLVDGGGGTSYNHAGLWENGSIIDLGTLQDGIRSNAFGINEKGQIVGKSTMTSSLSDQSYHAILWIDGETFNLNDLVDSSLGWELSEAVDINEKSQISGIGFIDGAKHAYLLDPEAWSDLTIRAVIYTEEKGATDAVWKKGGEDTTSSGDRVVWGYFYADPNDMSWGSSNNPEVFVKLWYDAGGRIDANFFHVSVPDIDVSSTSSDVTFQGTANVNKRFIRLFYNDINGNGTEENTEDGIAAPGYSPENTPPGYTIMNDLKIGATINTVETAGSINALWVFGGQDTTTRGDQVVWGYFYADPKDVSWGSKNNPELFVKIWFDASGRIDVNFFHVSVPDIEVYSDYVSDGTYDKKGTTIMDDRYIRHEYTKQ